MKTAARIFIILSIAGSLITFFIMLFLSVTSYNSALESGTDSAIALAQLYTFLTIISAVPVLIGSLCLWRVSTAKKKPGILWSLVTLLLVNLIAGIIMLCMTDRDYNPNPYPQNGYYDGPNNGPYNGGYYDYSNNNNNNNGNNN